MTKEEYRLICALFAVNQPRNQGTLGRGRHQQWESLLAAFVYRFTIEDETFDGAQFSAWAHEWPRGEMPPWNIQDDHARITARIERQNADKEFQKKCEVADRQDEDGR